MKIKILLLLSLIGFGLIIFSCKDDDGGGDILVSPEIEMQLRVGSDNLSEGELYTIGGTAIQIDIARFYLGGIKFTGENTYEQNDYFVVSDNNKSFTLDNVVAGEYDFEFAIGVDANTNSQSTEDFTTRPVGDPLGLQEPAMHWNWSTGYKFLRIDGSVDTDADGIVDTPVQYHLGSNAFYSPLVAPGKVDFSVLDKKLTIRFDLEAFFNSVDLSNGESTHVGDNKPLADQLFANYTTAVSVLN